MLELGIFNNFQKFQVCGNTISAQISQKKIDPLKSADFGTLIYERTLILKIYFEYVAVFITYCQYYKFYQKIVILICFFQKFVLIHTQQMKTNLSPMRNFKLISESENKKSLRCLSQEV